MRVPLVTVTILVILVALLAIHRIWPALSKADSHLS